jgi:uncharacterized protein (DUF983 family)
MDSSEQTSAPDAWLFFKRALKLRCPECGISPIFKPYRDTHSFSEWLNPVEGCPRCGYKYCRENGYFLISIWAINYGVVGGWALLSSFGLDYLFQPPFWVILLAIVAPLPLFSVLFARHSKSLFLAMDHFFDPHLPRPKDPRPQISVAQRLAAQSKK